MKNITLFIIAVIFSLGSIAQNNINTGVNEEGNLFWKNKSPEIPAEGSPYIQENYEPIRIDKFENKPFVGRYNAFNDEMEVKMQDGKVIALDINGQYKVTFIRDGKTYNIYSYQTEEGINQVGYLVNVNSAANLLKKEKVKYYDAVSATTSFDRDQAAKFKRLNDDYYVKIGGEIKYLPTNKRKLTRAFPKNSKKIKSYLKEKDLDLDEESDLLELTKFIGTL